MCIRDSYTDEQITAAIEQAKTQNIISADLAETAIQTLNKGDGADVNAVLFKPEIPIVSS